MQKTAQLKSEQIPSRQDGTPAVPASVPPAAPPKAPAATSSPAPVQTPVSPPSCCLALPSQAPSPVAVWSSWPPLWTATSDATRELPELSGPCWVSGQGKLTFSSTAHLVLSCPPFFSLPCSYLLKKYRVPSDSHFIFNLRSSISLQRLLVPIDGKCVHNLSGTSKTFWLLKPSDQVFPPYLLLVFIFRVLTEKFFLTSWQWSGDICRKISLAASKPVWQEPIWISIFCFLKRLSLIRLSSLSVILVTSEI